MRPVHHLLVILSFCSLHNLQGQSREFNSTAKPKSLKTTLYYDLSWELTTPERSYYKREAYFDFTDMVFDGVFKDYNKEDVLITEGSYTHGIKGGLQTDYYPNRSLKSIIEFEGNDFTIWEFRPDQYLDSVKNGNGKFSLGYFYVSGLVSSPSWKQGTLNGEFRFGKRAGKWIYQDLGKKKTDEETYENGKLKTRFHFTESTTLELTYKKDIIISLNSLVTESLAYDKDAFGSLNEVFEQRPIYTSTFNREITYPGGMKKLLLLLAQYAEVPQGAMCIVKLRIDDRGKIVKYSLAESAGSFIDERAIKELRLHEKRFLPAIKNGLPYPSTIYVPISGGDYWINLLKATPIEEILLMR